MITRTNDEVRAHVHDMWAAVADAWGQHADDVDRRGAELTARMLAVAAPERGDRVLELACGAGGAGLAAAARVGSDGEVVLSDVVAEMTSIAGDRARRLGLTNVRVATLDLEQIAEPDGAYDVVLCREGLMFAVDPQRACTEIYRVLRPSGRVAVSVWGPRQQNPWLGVVFEAVGAVTGFPVPPPGMPGPFALEDEVQLRTYLTTAGLADVVVEQLQMPLRSPSFEAWWNRTKAVAGPVASIINRLDASAVAVLEERLRVAVAPYTTASGVELPGLVLLASAYRP